MYDTHIPIWIKTIDINPNDWNPNEMSESEFAMLLDNISRLGFADPLLVTKDGDNKYKVVDGEHRYRAALLAGLEEIPAVVVELTEEDQRLQTVRMNQIKGEWNPTKFNNLVNDMMQKKELTIEDAAYELGFADPSDFHLLRDLMRESLPSTRTKKEFDIKAKEANNTQELYSILNEIMERLQNPDKDKGSLWVKENPDSKNIWVVTDEALVEELVLLKQKYKGSVEEQVIYLIEEELGRGRGA